MIKKYFLLIIPLLVGYLAGIYFPIAILKPNYSDSEILTKPEYYSFIISLISALITFLAILVALFKDDIRAFWKRPKLELLMPNKITIEELNDISDSNNSTLISNKYISRIEVKNNGNLPAINTEIFLEKLEFQEKNSTIKQPIECYGKSLIWNGTDSDSMIIPVGSKKLINIVTITAPEKVSKPDSQTVKNPSIIIIGDIKNKKEQKKGTWFATFGLYAQNHNPIKLSIEMEWNGVWKTRLTEFNAQFNIKKI